MGGVRHEAAAGVLRGLQPVGQAVELACNLGDLVAAADLGTVGIGALAHLADGLQEIGDARSERMGQQHTQAHHQQRNHGGNAHQIRLEAAQQLRLLRIVLIGAYRADDLIAENHRRGGTAQKRLTVIAAVKRIVALQRLRHLGEYHIAALGALRFAGIVEHAAGRIRHQNTAHAVFLHAAEGLTDIVLRQLLQSRQRRFNHLHAAGHGGFLGAEHQILGHQQRIGV